MRKQELLKHVEQWRIVAVLASLFFLMACSSGVDVGGGDLPTVVQVVLSDSKSGSAMCRVDVSPNINSPVSFYFNYGTVSSEFGDVTIAKPCSSFFQLSGLGVNQGGKMNNYGCKSKEGNNFECTKNE